jgi:hypothetical protein
MTVLIPLTCCSTASPTPTTSAARTSGCSRSDQLPGLASSPPLICSSSRSIATGSSTRIFASVARASKSSPVITSQRGLCGMRSIPIASARAGTTPRPSIQRQPSTWSKASPTR